MSDLRPRGVPITVHGEDRSLLFTLNAIDKIQEKFDRTLSEVIDDIVKFDLSDHVLRDVLLILLEDEEERESKNQQHLREKISEKELGWFLGLDNQAAVTALVLKAYGVSLPEPDESDPNREGGQQNS